MDPNKQNTMKVLILSLLMLSGCGGMTMTGGYIDPGFVHQSILAGRMAVVGVTSLSVFTKNLLGEPDFKELN